MGLAAMHQSWARSGFGKWAHINPGIALRIAVEAQKELAAVGLHCSLSSIPHIIYKPPGGSELCAHTDQIPPVVLIQKLEEHVLESDASTTAWVKKNGLQCLAHIDGGNTDGYTYAIGPMTPHKLLVCLRAIASSRIPGILPTGTSLASWLKGGTGPSFLKWRAKLGELNAILLAEGEDVIRVCPITPDRGATGPFLAAWPVGFPHGSAKNLKRRITTTAPLSIRSESRDDRGVKRLRAFATIASGTGDMDAAERFITNDTLPYAGGKTHKKPQLAARWIRPGAPYHSIAPTHQDVDAFEQAWNK